MINAFTTLHIEIFHWLQSSAVTMFCRLFTKNWITYNCACQGFSLCRTVWRKPLTFTSLSFSRIQRKWCPMRKWNHIFLHCLHPDRTWGTRGPMVNRAPTRSLRALQETSHRKESQQVRTTTSQRTLGSKWQLAENKTSVWKLLRLPFCILRS